MAKQLSLPLRRRGGRRPGAGRKPNGTRSGTAHRPRAEFRSRKPVLVTKRLLRCIPSLRQPGMFPRIVSAKSFERPRPQAARTWLLRVGWRKHGKIDPAYVPG